MRETGSQLLALCFGAADPSRLALFWAGALRWELGDETAGEVGVVPTDGTRFGLTFRPVAERKAGANRLHLDLTSSSPDDQRDTVARFVELGARHIDIGQTPEEGHVVLADPEGNELCIIGPGNTFLAGCERVGSITCDGSQAVGYFWSEALGWPLVWDQDEETAIRAPDLTGPLITWGGPPVAPKVGTNRLQLDLAPLDGVDPDGEIERLIALGATRVGAGETEASDADGREGDATWVAMVDPDDNEFRVRRSR